MKGLIITFLFLGFQSRGFADTPMPLVALGDSTTAGTPAFFSPAERPPNGYGNPESQYAHWITQRHPDWKVINRGIAGQRSDQILARFDSEALRFKPQVLIVLAGVNDIYQGYSTDSLKENLKKIYDRALNQNMKVLVCTILPFNSAGPEMPGKIREVNHWIKSYAEQHNLGFCDTYTATEDPAARGNLIGSPDGLHPDIPTYRKMGEAITFSLEKMIGNG